MHLREYNLLMFYQYAVELTNSCYYNQEAMRINGMHAQINQEKIKLKCMQLASYNFINTALYGMFISIVILEVDLYIVEYTASNNAYIIFDKKNCEKRKLNTIYYVS